MMSHEIEKEVLEKLKKLFKERNAELGNKFAELESKFNTKFAALEGNVIGLKSAFDIFETKLDTFETKLDTFDTNLETLGNNLGGRLTDIEDRFGRMERAVRAIESFPVPYGRPKTFHSVVELHSVSMPLIKRRGYSSP